LSTFAHTVGEADKLLPALGCGSAAWPLAAWAVRRDASSRRADEWPRKRPNIPGVPRGIHADASAAGLAGGAEFSHRLALARR
jgi:hypothetical protein